MGGDRLAAAVLSLPAPWLGHFVEVVDSTQDQARQAARDGAPTRSVFVADYQRAGRGRAGRQWLAAPGTALLLSILFRAESHSPWRYTSLASLALIHTIDQLRHNARTAIKWPNDVMLEDKKVAGVLAETTWDGRVLQAMVGIGVNVSASPEDIPEATSLDSHIDRGDLLLAFIRHLDSLEKQPLDRVFEQWQSRLWRRGQHLRLQNVGREEDVVILGAGADGSLHIRSADGTERHTTTGELLP